MVKGAGCGGGGVWRWWDIKPNAVDSEENPGGFVLFKVVSGFREEVPMDANIPSILPALSPCGVAQQSS